MDYTKPKRPGIYGFDGPHRYLSNFYIEPDGTHVEGEYQRAKCAEAHQRKLFESNLCGHPMHPPSFCKGLGQQVKIRADWEQVKVEVMLFYVMKKFRDHPNLAERLKETGINTSLGRVTPLYLEETNTWGDQFWGVSRGRGLNVLGFMLMDVRAEL